MVKVSFGYRGEFRGNGRDVTDGLWVLDVVEDVRFILVVVGVGEF